MYIYQLSNVKVGKDQVKFCFCQKNSINILIILQVLFPLFKEHHKEIEDQAAKAKQSLKDKFGDFFKSDKKENGKEKEKENGKHETLDKIEHFFKSKDKPEKTDEKIIKQN